MVIKLNYEILECQKKLDKIRLLGNYSLKEIEEFKKDVASSNLPYSYKEIFIKQADSLIKNKTNSPLGYLLVGIIFFILGFFGKCVYDEFEKKLMEKEAEKIAHYLNERGAKSGFHTFDRKRGNL
jgi:hypothetical protein